MAWIPVKKRLPPKTNETIITWCPHIPNYQLSRPAFEARMDAERFLNEPPNTLLENWAKDRIFSHWIKLPKPKIKTIRKAIKK